jgi:hypothetical protein
MKLLRAVDNHTLLGKTSLPSTLNSLLKIAVGSSSQQPSDAASTLATYEILRVGANLCMDHGKYALRVTTRGPPPHEHTR